MLIGVPAETAAGETRVAVTPETAKKLVGQGHTVRVQSGAGLRASATDEAYQAAGAEITDAAGAFGAEMVLKVRNPSPAEIAAKIQKQYESLNTWVSDMGGTLHVLSDADYAEADRLTEPVMREWIDIVTKAGLPGKAIEAKFRELETRYAKPWNQSHSIDIAGKK